MRRSEVYAAWTSAVDRASVSNALRRFVRFSVIKFFVPFNFNFAANNSRHIARISQLACVAAVDVISLQRDTKRLVAEL